MLQVRPNPVLKVSGKEMSCLPCQPEMFLILKDDRIDYWGEMKDCPGTDGYDQVIDATGRLVMPAWVDSHTHLVYAQSREEEFEDRIKGFSYEEIAQRGGGILNSAEKMRMASEQELFQGAMKRIHNIMKQGTGAVEIKSGYGLDVESELKMLRVIKRLKEEAPITIKATFLGAHAVPVEYKDKPSKYVELIIQEMLPRIAEENLADFVDVFCEKGYFSLADTEAIVQAAASYGLKAKLHINQFNSIGGVAMGVKHQALSLDHLEVMNDEDIAALKGSDTMPVALPGCSFFLGIDYTPARKIIDAGLPLALATDFNPGSTPCGNMNLMVSMACIKMNMTPEEAINAATINAAYAMGLSHEYGSITPGYKANLIITKQDVPSKAYIPYCYGDILVEQMIVNGKLME